MGGKQALDELLAGDDAFGYRGGDRPSVEAAAREDTSPPSGRPARLTASRIATSLVRSLGREIEFGRGFLWLPVLYGLGILIYFAVPREPSLVALAAVAAAFALAAVLARGKGATFFALVAATGIASGATAMKIRTDLIAAPVLAGERTLTLTGWIADYERAGQSGARLTVLVKELGKLTPAETPFRVRVTARSGADKLAYGDAISALVRLAPPPGPALPGGYDFALADFYQGIGATGFTLGAPKKAELGRPPTGISLYRPLERLRAAISHRIAAALSGDDGAIAAALIMGDQGAISDETQAKYRASGLAHILSISGLHMALVAGTVFWLVRAFLALFPGIALRRPIKKWAAAAALLVAAIYLGISGASVPTIRSFVMLAVMLGAVLVDRRAATVRNVAIAAFVVLVVAPESLITASFQMSFAAALAIIAAYEYLGERRIANAASTPKKSGIRHRVAAELGGLIFTSLIAGLATAPFVAFHFQRMAALSLLANIGAGPAVSIIVMPMALLAVILMPFGLEPAPLAAMAWGLHIVNAVNDWVADRSVGFGQLTAPPVAALLLAVCGLLWLCLWRERWRLFGLLPILLALPIAVLAVPPDILINAAGTAVAVRGDDHRYRIVGGKGATFEIGQWLRADGDLRGNRDKTLAANTDCDRLGCTARIGAAETRVALSLDRRAFNEDCRLSAIVVTPLVAPADCSATALVIDRATLADLGSHAIWLSRSGQPSGFRIATAYAPIRRPFTPRGQRQGQPSPPADPAAPAQ